MKTGYLYSSFLVAYVSFMYWEAVFSREVTLLSGYKLELLWTYKAICEGGNDALKGEILINVLMFIPVGVFVGLIIISFGISLLKGCLIALFLGAVLSFGIELLQLFLKVGLCETDDILHNTIGCMFGYAIVWLISN